MKAPWLLAGIVAVIAGAGAIGGFVWWRGVEERHAESQGALEEAREFLEAAKGAESRSQAQALLTQVLQDARKAAQTWDRNAFEGALLEGEALLLLTKYSAAVEILERAVAERPEESRALALAARAHHESFRLAKRDADYAAALQLYERAAERGAAAPALLGAAEIAEEAGQRDLADRYVERLAGEAPGSEELRRARALQSGREGTGRK